MEELNFEQFLEYTWDYVSPFVVTDDFWEQNQELINEMTFSLYLLYKSSIKKENVYTPKFFGKVLEAVFSNLDKFNYIKSGKQ